MSDWSGAKPRRDRITVQQRHLRIVELRAVNLPLKAIAREVGLNDHSSVIHHLRGNCRCGLDLGRLDTCPHKFVTVCQRCGVTRSRNGNGATEAAAATSRQGGV